MSQKLIAILMLLSVSLTTWAQNANDSFFSPYISVRHDVKNIRLRYFPISSDGKPDSLEHLVQAAGDRLLGHEAAHVVQQREGVLIRKMISSGRNGIANILIHILLTRIGRSNVPFDASVFLGQLHFESIGEELPAIAMLAGQIAKHKHIYQHNQSDLEFLRGRKSKCYEKQCDSDIVAELDKRIAELQDEQARVTEIINVQYKVLRQESERQERKFNTLSNASKARHDIALNAIRNMK